MKTIIFPYEVKPKQIKLLIEDIANKFNLSVEDVLYLIEGTIGDGGLISRIDIGGTGVNIHLINQLGFDEVVFLDLDNISYNGYNLKTLGQMDSYELGELDDLTFQEFASLASSWLYISNSEVELDISIEQEDS